MKITNIWWVMSSAINYLKSDLRKATQGWLEMEFFSYQVTAMKYPMQEFSFNYHSILFLTDLYSNTVPARVCNEALGN